MPRNGWQILSIRVGKCTIRLWEAATILLSINVCRMRHCWKLTGNLPQ